MFFVVIFFYLSISVVHCDFGCEKSYIQCVNKTHCVPISKVCVEYFNCVGARGENLTCLNCAKESKGSLGCLMAENSKWSFRCLSPDKICDKHLDCLNEEDEHQCGKERCPVGQWLCPNEKCIDREKVCDGIQDCSNGNDENQTSCDQVYCDSGYFFCSKDKCIPNSKICDGVPDCLAGEDEDNCENQQSSTSEKSPFNPEKNFFCSSSRSNVDSICIPDTRVCDGQKDCEMGDDEADCDTKCVSSNGCPVANDVQCLTHPLLNSLCRCKNSNYEIRMEKSPNEKSQCRDLNECNDPFRQHCSFQCKNIDGGFNCSCPPRFTLSSITFSCEKSSNDIFRPNLLLVLSKKVNFYNVGDVVVRHHHLSTLYKSIEFSHYDSLNLIQFDSHDHFLIFHRKSQRSIDCLKQDGSKAVRLISDVDAHRFTYDSEEKSLFILENQRNTLDFYGNVRCDVSYKPQRHSWKLPRPVNSFKFIEVDYNLGKLFFVSEHKFHFSNLSQPNEIQYVHRTKRSIQHVVYDKAFQRFFWTASNTTSNELFPLYTCDGNFQSCHDSLLRLPNPKLFAFFNDSIVYATSPPTSIEMTKIFGKTRFSTKFLLNAETEIISLIPIDPDFQPNSRLCTKDTSRLCPNGTCYRTDRTRIVCLSIDNPGSQTPPNFALDPDLYQSNDENSSSNHGKSGYIFVKIFFLLVFICGFVGLLFFFLAKRRIFQFRHKFSNPIQPPTFGENLTISEPILDEFNVFIDDPYKDRLPLTDQLQY